MTNGEMPSSGSRNGPSTGNEPRGGDDVDGCRASISAVTKPARRMRAVAGEVSRHRQILTRESSEPPWQERTGRGIRTAVVAGLVVTGILLMTSLHSPRPTDHGGVEVREVWSRTALVWFGEGGQGMVGSSPVVSLHSYGRREKCGLGASGGLSLEHLWLTRCSR